MTVVLPLRQAGLALILSLIFATLQLLFSHDLLNLKDALWSLIPVLYAGC
ncbi:hypothetical protein TOL_1579 [Thalassolituus oleivorans MIL-1]|uniref:Uncharacterized protein n=1 Tax=Thalassolituus oleivorans MIL-1 TaxID=1298593 RepID=M5E3B1_9GAMM|nr:hypothetical protein TOL_1579 [Thalassolituus oleivorans MIL-1]